MISKKVLTIPNGVTLLNLIIGCMAIGFVSLNYISYFLWAFLGCLILDSLDGWYARSYNCATDFGKKFDAFADVFSFGFIITFLIATQIFQNPPFWRLLLAGWITLANIIRYFKLVANRDEKVYGVPNVAVSILILSLFMQKAIPIDQDTWSYLIAILGFLMLIPVEFINHKTLKSIILPSKKNFAIFLIPLVLIPLLDSTIFWMGVLIVSGVYVGYIIFYIPSFITQLLKPSNTETTSRNKIFIAEYSFYSLATITIILLRIAKYNV